MVERPPGGGGACVLVKRRAGEGLPAGRWGLSKEPVT